MKLSKNSTKITSNLKRAFRLYGTKRVDSNVTLFNVHSKYNGICVDCKKKTIIGIHPTIDTSATIEHINPLSQGGDHTWSNVELLCQRCNQQRNHKFQTKWNLVRSLRLFNFEIRIGIKKFDRV